MKTYSYFPGCSLEKMAHSYHISALASSKALGVELKELDDWNCCGATTYFHIDELLAYTLSARNLAMAEKEKLDVVTPCSGCYKNMYFTNKYLKKDPELAEHINYALQEDNLHFSGNINVHHLMEIFINEVGLEEIKKKVIRPLKDLRIAPYYGCQLLRPKKDHQDTEQPHFFEDLLSTLGASPIDYQLKLYCCGGSLIISNRKASLKMIHNLLQSALDNKADMIVTICPLCQINLECYQKQINHKFHTNFAIPVFYFTQILGLALGIPKDQLGIGSELISTKLAILCDEN